MLGIHRITHIEANLLTFLFCLFVCFLEEFLTNLQHSVQAVLIYILKKHIYKVFLLTCCCEGADSEGKLWDDRLRGGGCGGSRLCGAVVWDGCDPRGIRGSCIFSTGGGWVVGWADPAAWGFSGSGSNGAPASTFAVFLIVKNCNRNLKNGMNENMWMWKHETELRMNGL